MISFHSVSFSAYTHCETMKRTESIHLFDCNFFFVLICFVACMDEPFCVWLYQMEKTKLNDANIARNRRLVPFHTFVLRHVHFHTHWNVLWNKFDSIILAFVNCVSFSFQFFWEIARSRIHKHTLIHRKSFRVFVRGTVSLTYITSLYSSLSKCICWQNSFKYSAFTLMRSMAWKRSRIKRLSRKIWSGEAGQTETVNLIVCLSLLLTILLLLLLLSKKKHQTQPKNPP